LPASEDVDPPQPWQELVPTGAVLVHIPQLPSRPPVSRIERLRIARPSCGHGAAAGVNRCNSAARADEVTLPAVVKGYRLMSADHALSSISLRRLKVTRFSEANDPFELMALNCLRRDIRKNLNRYRRQDLNLRPSGYESAVADRADGRHLTSIQKF
jgi:hypothetical protein